jgi:hypothetical protein
MGSHALELDPQESRIHRLLAQIGSSAAIMMLWRAIHLPVRLVRVELEGRLDEALNLMKGRIVIIRSSRSGTAVSAPSFLIGAVLSAKVLVAMEPLPTRMTTRSFELLMEAVGLVRHDAPAVFQAIEELNPYAAGVRQRFFALAPQHDAGLANHRGVLAGTENGNYEAQWGQKWPGRAMSA